MKDMCTSAIHEFGILTKKDNLMKWQSYKSKACLLQIYLLCKSLEGMPLLYFHVFLSRRGNKIVYLLSLERVAMHLYAYRISTHKNHVLHGNGLYNPS